MTTRRYTLVSAVVGDRVPGIEVSDPDCPIDIMNHPAAVEWAEAQGWGIDDPDELIYVLTDDEDAPAGFPLYRIDVESEDATTGNHELDAWLGDFRSELTNDQFARLCRETERIQAQHPGVDDADEREAALSAAAQYLIGDITLDAAGDERRATQAAELRARVSAIQVAAMAADDGVSESEAARRGGIDRMTVRAARGK